MQKFKPQSCVRNFCNKSTLSTPCFAAFHSVWLLLGPFRYCMKLGAKWAELMQLMQKFMPRSRVQIFRNECNYPPPLEPKIMFCFVSQCLSAFGTVSLLYDIGSNHAKLLQLMQKFKPQVAIEFFAINPPNPRQTGPKLMLWCIS